MTLGSLISEEEYLEHVKPALMKVFKDCIYPAFGGTLLPFQDAIEARLFVFGYAIEPPLDNPIFWNALLRAILEEFCWKCILGSDIPLSDLYAENRAICSLQGNWGILFDCDGLGLIGGPTSFIDNIRKGYPEIDRHIYYYLENIKPTNTSIEYFKEHGKYEGDGMYWLPETIIHIYGEKNGKEIIEDARKMNIYYWD
jgi:hypothetical protein